MLKGKKSKVKTFFQNLLGKNAGEWTFNIFNYLFLLLVAFCMAYPFYHVLKVSLTVRKLVPETNTVIHVLNFASYLTVLGDASVIKTFFFSIAVVLCNCLGHLLICILSAYPLSRSHLKFKTGIFLYIVITMLFGGGLIPFYILIRDLGLRNNPLVYVVLGLCGGFNIIICKNFFMGIPDSLEESAKIDGANDFTILFRIYVPLSLPIIATIALWVGVGKWNDWMTGVLYMGKKDMKMMQNYLREILVAATSSDPTGAGVDPNIKNMASGVKMATIVIGTLPIICIYPFLQKYFVKGTILGSVKG